MTAPTLTEFLLARIAEDEANIDGDWSGGDGGLHIISAPMRDRLLAECAGKRRIVERLQHTAEDHWSYGVLRDLASVYADHPDYNEERKP